MKRYRSIAAVIGQLLAFAALGALLAVVGYIVWDMVLGLDGQHFVITVVTVFVLPLLAVCITIAVAALGYAFMRDRTRGVL